MNKSVSSVISQQWNITNNTKTDELQNHEETWKNLKWILQSKTI